MNTVKNIFFIATARFTKNLSKFLNRGSGTALPGLIIEKYYPELFDYFSLQLNQTILITGTNGKTTTKSMLHEVLKEAEIQHLTNTSGSNLKRGLISTFIENSSLKGRLNSSVALLEVEEATLPKIIDSLKPSILIVTNLFRDQLDAYGEINKTRKYILEAIRKSPHTKLVLNADDGMVSSLAENTRNETYYFSLTNKYSKEFLFENKPNNLNTKPALKPSLIELHGDLTSQFEYNNTIFDVNVPGIFHVYNALAAMQAAILLGLQTEQIKQGLSNFKPAFGRGELLKVEKQSLPKALKNFYKQPFYFQLFLIKNPAGFTLTLNMLKTLRKAKLLIIINDNIADGRDVSWLWDAQVEKIQHILYTSVIVSGKRAEDMALRLKYAHKNIQKHPQITIKKDIQEAIVDIMQTVQKEETVYVLPTYTAMNEFRKILGKRF